MAKAGTLIALQLERLSSTMAFAEFVWDRSHPGQVNIPSARNLRAASSASSASVHSSAKRSALLFTGSWRGS